jgi:hypothetical protein
MTHHDELTNESVPGGSPTSSSMRAMVSQAHVLITDADESLDKALASLADETGLLEAERRQLAEISHLLGICGQTPSFLEGLRRDGDFAIAPSEDRMMLTLTVHPPMAGGRAVEMEQILTWLRERDIQQGVDMNAIRHALHEAQRQSVENIVIVRGRLPKPGCDGRVEIYGRRSSEEPLELIAATGGAMKVAGLWLCSENDEVARIIAPEAGTPGYDALGAAIAPPPLHAGNIELGPNVRLDGFHCYADVGGVVVYAGNRLEVRKVLVINRPLTRCEKPLDFDGEIHVRASIGSGVIVRATGNILVDGAVEAATLESRHGSIKLRHGVAGQNRATIRAEEDVVSRFVENAFVLAGRDIIIETGALHSRLVAGRAIHLNRGRGQLIGGTAMAGTLIEVKQLGAKSNVATEVIVGVSKQTLEKLGEIDQAIAQDVERETSCGQLADRMQRAVGDLSRLQEAELQAYVHLRKSELVCKHRIRRLRSEREQVFAEGAKSSHGQIDVLGEILCGTQIRIGDATLTINKVQPRCRVTYDKTQRKLVTGRLH